MQHTENELTLTRLIEAPRKHVWKAWTDSTLLAQWWGPDGFTNPLCTIHVRRGGAIRIDMRGPDGTVYPLSGKYLEVVEPTLLVFTNSALDSTGKPLFNVFNTITFADQDGKTKLIMHASISHKTPEAESYIEGMETGWTQSLVRLTSLIAKGKIAESFFTRISSWWSSGSTYVQSALRMAAAVMFILAGTVKLFAFPIGMPPNGGTVRIFTQIGIGAILEAFGGTFLLLGLFTRPVAFILAGEMAVAYFQFHAPGGIWPVVNGGMPAVLYCFIWLYISAAGPGQWSLDALRKK
jgi:putative oxidoreductase